MDFIRPTISVSVTKDTSSKWVNVAEHKVGTEGSKLQLTISDLIVIILFTKKFKKSSQVKDSSTLSLGLITEFIVLKRTLGL